MREQRRRGQRHRDPIASLKEVLGVERRVIGAAAGSEHDCDRLCALDGGGNRLQRGRIAQQPRGYRGLLPNLASKMAHRSNTMRPATIVKRTRIWASRMIRSA